MREVRLRGLLATGRTAQAIDLAGHHLGGSGPPSPHWRVIERITTAEVLARAGDERTAETMLTAAISEAETLRLPHQIQRIIRLAGPPGVPAGQTVHQQARAALTRLDRQLHANNSRTGRPRGTRPAIAHHRRSSLIRARAGKPDNDDTWLLAAAQHTS